MILYAYMCTAKSPEYQVLTAADSEDQKMVSKSSEPPTSFVLEAKEMCRRAVKERNLTLEEKNTKLKYVVRLACTQW